MEIEFRKMALEKTFININSRASSPSSAKNHLLYPLIILY